MGFITEVSNSIVNKVYVVVGRVCLGDEGSDIDICYSYLC